MTTSLAYIDRGLMHAVEHHNDLFSSKKYNNYAHRLTLNEFRCKYVIECGNELLMQKNNILTLLALNTAASCLK